METGFRFNKMPAWSALITVMALLLMGEMGFAVAAVGIRHDLRVRLFPEESRLEAVDDIELNSGPDSVLSFSLSGKARVGQVAVNGKNREFVFRNSRLEISPGPGETGKTTKISIRYEGVFDDPLPVSSIGPDDPGYGVRGHISAVGAFLLPESGWYPEMAGAQPTFSLRVEAPEAMIAVSAGRCIGIVTGNGKTVSTWESLHPAEGIALSAAPYRVEEKMAGRVKVYTFLFPENRHLAGPYLEASIRYLAMFEELFGPYPYEKFAVVENFFPTGYGFPSYTLLGSTVLRLPFILHTSLPHEIAHNWWGNGVFVDFRHGNWCEGLTTYVADYHLAELESVEKTREYRRQILREYSTLVHPGEDFPLSDFRSRIDPVSKAIGYGKGAMVFHMLRNRVGDQAFWESLRDLYREHKFLRASWEDIRHAFERRSGLSLDRFFRQWLSRPGAIRIRLDGAVREKTETGWRVRGKVVQEPPAYEFDAVVSLEGRDGKTRSRIRVSREAESFQETMASTPISIALDPDDDLFRRLHPSEIPPSVNSIKASDFLMGVPAGSSAPAMTKVLERLAASLGIKHLKVVSEKEAIQNGLPDANVLYVGLPVDRRLLSEIPETLRLEAARIVRGALIYEDPSDAFFGVFPHPVYPDRVVGVFHHLSFGHAAQAAEKITHYGRYGYLIFHQGKNVEKGMWPVIESPLIHRWDPARL